MMNKSLLHILSLQYPLDLTKTQIKGLKLGSRLFELGFFDLHELKKNYPCDNCSEFHEVFEEFGEYYYICNLDHGGKESVLINDIQIYRFNLERFLLWFAQGLKIKPDVQELDGGIWKIGSIDHKGKNIHIKYSLKPVGESNTIDNTLNLANQDLEIVINYDDSSFGLSSNIFSQMLDELVKPIDLGGRFVCGNITVDTNRGTFSFKDQEVEISPEHKTIKFLVLLMKNANVVVEHTKIAEATDSQFYKAGDTNKQIAREVQYFKRDLGIYLKDAGLSANHIKEVKSMIKAKTNLGYKLICP